MVLNEVDFEVLAASSCYWLCAHSMAMPSTVKMGTDAETVRLHI